MEHLLFGDRSDALAGPAGALRCGYLEALATVAHDEIDGVRQDWEGDGESPGYDRFFDGSASSSLHPREGEAEVVRSLVFMVRTIANMRLGAALGVDTQADPVAIPPARPATPARTCATSCSVFPRCTKGLTAISTPWVSVTGSASFHRRWTAGWPGRSKPAGTR